MRKGARHNSLRLLRVIWHRLDSSGRNLAARLASAVVLAPIGLFCVWQGGVALQLILGSLTAIAAVEWRSMLMKHEPEQTDIGGILLALAVIAAVIMVRIWPFGVLLIAAMVIVFSLLFAAGNRMAMAFAGIYLICPAPAFIMLREEFADGRLLALTISIIVIGVDITAYFSGRLFGGARLLPAVSPSKTWAGAIGGLSIAGLIGLIGGIVCSGSLIHWLIAGLIAGLVAQIGDLLESVFKRRFGVKDASNLVPGHGGVLDRLDSFIVISFLALFVAMLAPDLLPGPGR